MALVMVPNVLVVLAYFSIIFLYHQYDDYPALEFVIGLLLSLQFLEAFLLAKFGCFLPTEPKNKVA